MHLQLRVKRCLPGTVTLTALLLIVGAGACTQKSDRATPAQNSAHDSANVVAKPSATPAAPDTTQDS